MGTVPRRKTKGKKDAEDKVKRTSRVDMFTTWVKKKSRVISGAWGALFVRSTVRAVEVSS